MSKSSRKLLDPEEEKKRAERRRRERRHRERDTKDGKSSKKPDRKLDIIDKLDVTSIYGTGCEYFHPLIQNTALIRRSIPSRWAL